MNKFLFATQSARTLSNPLKFVSNDYTNPNTDPK